MTDGHRGLFEATILVTFYHYGFLLSKVLECYEEIDKDVLAIDTLKDLGGRDLRGCADDSEDCFWGNGFVFGEIIHCGVLTVA